MKIYFTSNFTVKLLPQNIRVWPWSLKQNISWQIGFQTTNFVFINLPEVWWWEQHNHMTPRPTFYPKTNQKPTLQALTLQTYTLAPLTRWHCDLQKWCDLTKLKKVFFRKDRQPLKSNGKLLIHHRRSEMISFCQKVICMPVLILAIYPTVKSLIAPLPALKI